MQAVGICDCPIRILRPVQLFNLVRRLVLVLVVVLVLEFWPRGVMESWSVGVLRQVRIAAREAGLGVLTRRFVLLMNTAASDAQRLEGSRLVRRQLYGMAAGGSRKRPKIHHRR
jgi:hypothetical protein